MVFWILAALATGVVILAITWPLAARESEWESAAIDGSQADIAVYKDQLAEVDADLRRGLLGPEDAEGARIEISRRLLAAAQGDGANEGSVAKPTGERARKLAFAACATLVPITVVGLYLELGAPLMPDLPRSARLAIPTDKLPATELIARIEARLKEFPSDGRGWELIAPIYLRQSRFAEAQTAYANAIRVLGETPERLFGLANASVGANRGTVTDDAFEVFSKLAEANPGRAQPLFWRAVGLEQRGRMREARSAYSAILEKSADAPEVQRASRLRLSRLDAAAAKASRAPTNENSNIGSAPRPNAGDAQTKLIEQMVSGLDKRLREEGGSVEEWQRLIRSYVVLGRTDDATGVLRRALAAFPDNEAASKTLAAFGKSLGLKAS